MQPDDLAAIDPIEETEPSSPRQMQPVARQAMHQSVYLELRRAIVAGQWPPGKVLTIRALAAELGTSPMPVREALHRLVAERAIEGRPNRTIALPRLTSEEFMEIAQIRAELEGLAASVAAENMTEERLAELTAINDIYTEHGDKDGKAALEANRLFHFTLYQGAGMPTLMSMIEGLWVRIGPILNFTVRGPNLAIALRHHGEILQALQDGDPLMTRAAVAADILEAACYIAEALDAGQDP
jgi:DNA-binding GntR family transcriptional regulator